MKNTILLGITISVIVSVGYFSQSIQEASAGFTLSRDRLSTDGPIGDWRCWFTDDHAPPFDPFVDLTDQFGFMENVQIGRSVELCASADKRTSDESFPSPFGQNQHFVGYDLTANPRIEPETHSVLIPQFDILLTEITVFQPAELLVPTTKFIDEDPFDPDNPLTEFPNLTDLHYKCYFIEEPPTVQIPDFTLFTQFNPNGVADLLGDPFLFCNPAIKDAAFWEPSDFGALIDEHLICFEIVIPGDPVNPINVEIINQFTFESQEEITLDGPEKICFEALKDPETPGIGGTFIPVETTPLLLAAMHTTASWLIPIVVTAIGFGIVILRKL